jgi:tetratricopeptide (TPR) repeat protein
MIRCRQLVCLALAVTCGAFVCSCSPSNSSVPDEKKEAHYLVGRSRVNAMDYKGAIEAFEQALEVNPHSASAHFELGWLLEEKGNDPAAAIYHYQQYLKLSSNADNAANVNQHIQILKQDLAKNVLPSSLTPAMQREFDQLAEEKRQLSEEVASLREEVEKWRAYYSAHGGTAVQQPPANSDTDLAARASAGGQGGATSVGAPIIRTHKVAQGETPSSIARKYGVKVDVLMAANPGLKPTQMQIGQVVNVPGQ